MSSDGLEALLPDDGSPAEGAVYCASEKAILAATEAYWVATGKYADPKGLAAAFIAAHDKSLGFDRSIVLGDLVGLTEQL